MACELFGTWVGNGVGSVCIGVPAPLFGLLALDAVTLAQELSYCEGAPALLYAAPPLPPGTLTVPGSLCVEPGDVAELPGALVAGFALLEEPHALPWELGVAYAGAAPMTATATMQLAENSLCLMFALRFLGRTERCTSQVHDVDRHLVHMSFAARDGSAKGTADRSLRGGNVDHDDQL
ncbi:MULTISPECIES: hypothetical protein [unclassified Mycolicibacterium]|uniref:hypothetical protein n=1 Tax=unclassified Mycolicibacterium TaxID=2636767 RepID=UPI0012DE1EF7|nr:MULTISPECIES: hypothetical protein [unclassified Mycolicibacterium]MUL84667.1 hypothetical protein [Mycolicibacterium sp. CBMA 329]MUL88442.1 hypothetical protein [Mycolicibacterium sp. CBMA 331]MUM00219.1 hypothetical protein [Mycolicibacterium sp. CBMA 334]MUM27879.1 hypothetical protein [Mycolicibacterium sp. CBMA 295]MUM40089.1 hypothetical protein [Mycolicibacterium sp. CBMA 247]